MDVVFVCNIPTLAKYDAVQEKLIKHLTDKYFAII